LEKEKRLKNRRSNVLKIIGIGLILSALSLIFIIYYPIIHQEVSYYGRVLEIKVDPNSVKKDTLTEESIPIDPEFSIVIPKLNANSRVIINVDPNNSNEYQRVLTKGVAHAKGTPLPESSGNTFLFSHSSDNIFNATRYNSVFFLLDKLVIGDVFYIFRNGNKSTFEIVEKNIVSPDRIDYLENLKGYDDTKTVTLMTCWPAGTTYKRLVVVGSLQE
jgi:LPXTG-site transpeptidase (sortase) family protein